MPSVINGNHLRVEIPQTTNGINLRYDSERNVVHKTIFLPLSAERYIRNKSSRLPKHLQYNITKVMQGAPAPAAPASGEKGNAPKKEK